MHYKENRQINKKKKNNTSLGKNEQRSGYIEEVLNGRPLGHIGLVVFYPVNTMITHL